MKKYLVLIEYRSGEWSLYTSCDTIEEAAKEAAANCFGHKYTIAKKVEIKIMEVEG